MKISIVTATYNSQVNVERCLKSVAKQTCRDQIEHIIIDGGSTDETLSIVSRYAHICRVVSEKDNGIYDAFNKGLFYARGEWIYYLNSDDELYDEFSIQQVIDIINSQEVSYVCAKVVICDSMAGTEWLQNPRKIKVKNDFFNYPSHQGFFIRTELLRRYGGFPRCFDLVSDSYVMLKAFLLEDGHYMKAPVARFFLGGVSSSVDNSAKVSRELEVIYGLLGIGEDKDKSDELSFANEKFSHMRNVALHYLNNDSLNFDFLNKSYSETKVGIFGTGVMSILIKKILNSYGINPCAFFVTEKVCDRLDDVEVKELNQIKDVDVLINCIEGTHSMEVSSQCLDVNNKLTIVNWHEIYA